VFSFPKTGYDPDPFPHCVVTGAWNHELIAQCKAECALVRYTKPKNGKSFCRDWIQLPEAASAIIRYASQPFFLQWLERTTGEEKLLPDPYLFGGGLHRIQRGGSLGMHIDFNYHGVGLYRRLNLLLYLNPEWEPEWGGYLSLAGKKLISPEANTMVVFTTDDESWHGHPEPLNCPQDVFRDSIALYYYSAIKPTRNFAEIRSMTLYES
jgi:Rps23 Pro-64 3,4-dihydroxylase Tpa1-like proline 4-hydroxylase